MVDETWVKVGSQEAWLWLAGRPFHSTMKERCKVMRGFSQHQSASLTMDGWLIYYNYVRRHMALGGSTPAEAAGIDIKPGRNRWQTLILRNN